MERVRCPYFRVFRSGRKNCGLRRVLRPASPGSTSRTGTKRTRTPTASWYGLIPESAARDFLRTALAKAHAKAPSDPAIHEGVERFLSRVREHTGVFVERAPAEYGFMHLTFEEYFAAKHLMRDQTEAIAELRPLRHRARWEEPIRLAIADQPPEFATKLIAGAILGRPGQSPEEAPSPSPLEAELHRDLFLALRRFGDAASAPSSPVSWWRGWVTSAWDEE